MNGMNNSTEDVVECPLCMEPLDVDDINFYPCTCGYQICRFCWHRIRTDENELCPACRKAYSENPAEFKPLSEEQMTALKTEKRLRDQKRKQKITENRKHLANVRVVQKNLVFVVGLPPRLADAEVLKKFEYFGKHGKIHKVVINPSTAYAGVQGPSASAYVTYCNNNDALRAIQTANNVHIDGRLIKSSLGTTKYCSHFMKNQQCPKPDCMYLHDLGDDEASFTKEEMHQGKHQEYEKRLHDALIAQTAAANNAPNSNNAKVDETKPIDTPNGLAQNNKEAWPCLSVSPTNKDTKTNGKAGKDAATKKSKSEKVKAKKVTTNGTTAYTNGKENGFTANKDANGVTDALLDKQKATMDADEELNLISEIENDALLADVDKTDTPSISSSSSGRSGTLSETASGKSTPGSFNDHPLQNSQTNHQQQVEQQNKTNLEKSSQLLGDTFGNVPISSEINTNCHSLTNGIAKIDTTDQFSKLSLFDNNSFFSNTFQPTTYFKMDQQQHRTGDSLSSTNSPQLPDLLNGTEISKERHERHEIDKLNILKGLGEFNQVNNLPGYSNTTENWDDLKYAMTKNKQSQLHQQQQQQKHQLEPDDLLNYQELQKRHNYINHTNSLGMPHFNGLQNDFSNDYFHNPSESSRFSQMLSQQQQQQNQNHARQQQPNGIHSSDNLNHIYPASMSKFFDFHKVQQQQQQQQQQNQQQNQYFNNSSRSDHMNVSNLMENHRLNSQFLDHTLNGLSGGSHVLHKQRMMPKFDQQLGSPQQQQQQQQQQQLNHNLLHSQQSNSRLPNQFSSNNADDDLGFDPFSEVQKDYEIFENESNHSKLLENCQRTRMPPPGFNHMNAFGLGVPRAQGSKILPFMNMGNCAQSPQSNWGQPQQQQQQNLGYQQSYDQSQNHLSQQNHQLNKGGYGSADWTMFDPAIVSMRQFPSQQSHADMFMPHLNQQQQQQQQTIQQQLGGQGLFENKLKNIDFSNRSGMLGGYGGGPHGMNLQNSIMNQQQQQQQQQNSPAQVNFSHSNWLNTDQTQNIFLNNLSNGFSNNFEKYSIPPGFQNSGSKQQKAECIN